MPEVDLSALNGRQLRQLLDASRARGDEALSSGIARELASRGGRIPEAGAYMTIRPAERRFLSDEEDDLPPEWTDPSQWPDMLTDPPSDSEAPPGLDAADRRPRHGEAGPGADVGEGSTPRRARRAMAGTGLALIAGFALGLAVAIFLARSPVVGGHRPLSQAPPRAAAPIQADAPLLPQSGNAVAQASLPTQAPEIARPPSLSTKGPAPGVPKRCAGAAAPADRVICANPNLRRLQAELWRAYGKAQRAHVDRGALRQRQLAWRQARNTVDDPHRLARLYEERIRWLNATAARNRR